MSLMPLTLRLAALAAVPVLALLADAPPGHARNGADTDMPLRCEIVERATATGLRLEGYVHADRAARGRYSLDVTQRSGQGSSVIRQSGAFSVAAGASVALGQASFGGDPGDYDAELTLSWDSRRTVCHSARGQADL
mgnify:CR=1 FL=1